MQRIHMKIILSFILLTSIASYAEDNNQGAKEKISLSNIINHFGKAPNIEQRDKINKIVNSIRNSLNLNQALQSEVKKYYRLLEIKKGGPEQWANLHSIGNMEFSPELPHWLIQQKIDENLMALEKSIATIINEAMDPYLIRNSKDMQFNENIIIASIITYNENTLPTSLASLVLPIEHNEKIKTNVIFSPEKDVNTSVLFTFNSDGYEMRIAIKEVREQLIEHAIKGRLSSTDLNLPSVPTKQ